jgi:histidine racemase
MLVHLAIFTEAGGNPTALVTDNIPFEKHKDVGRSIIETSTHWNMSHPVEQVAFLIEKTERFLKFRMAGGENCGNAIIAMGAYAINMQDGKSSVEIVLGTDQSNLRSEEIASSTENKVTKIDFKLERLEIDKMGDVTIIHLDGISHVVISVSSPDETKKEDIKALLARFSIINKSASGIMYAYDKGDSIYLDPFVYVRDLDTLTNETACGSGSVATGIWKVLREGKDIVDFPILQKTGVPIYVSVKQSDHTFSASVSAKVSLIYEGAITI